MRHIPLISIIALALFSFCCSQTKKNSQPLSSNYITKEIECNIFEEESFDSTFMVNGEETRLKCSTECFEKYSVPDTINDSIVEIYQDRLFRFSLKNSLVDTQFVVSKELIKNYYGDQNTYLKSLLVLPSIENIDTLNNSVLIHSAFMFPSGLGGSDFFEDVLFEITSRGKVIFKEIKEYKDTGFN
jgi:hypothetical protein